MTYDFIDSFCLSQKGAKKDFKEEWGATRYQIGDKMFALMGDNGKGKEFITVKCSPEHGEMLRAKYPNDIEPGYYMNKIWWNSVNLNGKVPGSVLKDMLKESYDLVFSGLTKKMQQSILEKK